MVKKTLHIEQKFHLNSFKSIIKEFGHALGVVGSPK